MYGGCSGKQNGFGRTKRRCWKKENCEPRTLCDGECFLRIKIKSLAREKQNNSTLREIKN
jgi:hypothetical protein